MSKAKKVIDSFMVQDYSSAPIRKAFQEFDAMANYMTQVCGKPSPTFVRLPQEVYKKLRERITQLSDKRRTIRDVRYNGLRIIN